MTRWMVAVCCALLACYAWAASDDPLKNALATMLITGQIEVAQDGRVQGYTIDHPEKIPPAVVDLIQKNVPGWEFQGGKHSNTVQKATMSLRIVAKPLDSQHYALSIRCVRFGDANVTATDRVTYSDESAQEGKGKRRWARTYDYPHEAFEAGVSGTVYLLVRVNRQGHVDEAAVEQVDLGVYGARESQMPYFRALLGRAAVEQARQWTFDPPTTGKHVSDPYWDIQTAVPFLLRGPGVAVNLKTDGAPIEDYYGQWQPYIPGPRESISWAKNDSLPSSSSDLIANNGIAQGDEQALQPTTKLCGVY
jgi:hypothetical protein